MENEVVAIEDVFTLAKDAIGGKELKMKNLEHVWQSLQEDEDLVAAFTATYQESLAKNAPVHNGTVFLITNKRLVFGKRSMLATFTKIIDLKEIKDFTFTRPGFLLTYLVIDMLTETINIALSKEESDVVIETLNDAKRELLNTEKKEIADMLQQRPQATQQADVADQIRSMKQLLDEGLITDDEFSQKKKQLLGL